MNWMNLEKSGLTYTISVIDPSVDQVAPTLESSVLTGDIAGGAKIRVTFEHQASGNANITVRVTFLEWASPSGASQVTMDDYDATYFFENIAEDTTTQFLPSPIEQVLLMEDATAVDSYVEFDATVGATFQALIEIGYEAEDPAVPPDTTSYNCSCDNEHPHKTLAEMRQDMLIELGYSQQLAAPPAGIVLRINRILARAQQFLYGEHDDFRTERFFSWRLEQGVRFYDVPQNNDNCSKVLDPSKLSWIGVTDGSRWYELVSGIPPENYSIPDIQGLPNRYEIRSCIELWPAPDSDNLMLRIKGNFGLLRFTEDTDITTIDPDAILYWALYMFKKGRGDADADDMATAALQRIGHITAAGHNTNRYIPGQDLVVDATRPLFLPLGQEEA